MGRCTIPVFQLLFGLEQRPGDRQLDFLQDADRFRQLQVMVRESSADFDGFQVAAVQDLDNLRPFLIGRIIPGLPSSSISKGDPFRIKTKLMGCIM